MANPYHVRLALSQYGEQFRAELFNIFNHPSFNNPAATFGTGTFGNITSTSTDNREIQFGLKLAF